MKRRALSFLLALLMIVSILPMAVFAEENELTAELYGFTFTASGEIPEGASLVVTDPGVEVESRIQQDVLGIGELGDSTMGYAFDIKIVDAMGNEWQPEDLGVTISISGFPVENAAVEVFHILDTAEAIDTAVEENVANVVSVDNADGAFDAELAASAEAESVDADEVVYTVVSGVQNMGDAISFPTDSFSAYYILTQTATRTIYITANTTSADKETHDVYVRPGENFTVIQNIRKSLTGTGMNSAPSWAWDDGKVPPANVMTASFVTDQDGTTYNLNNTNWSGYMKNDGFLGAEKFHKYTSTKVTVSVKSTATSGEYTLKDAEAAWSYSYADIAQAKAYINIHIVGDIPVSGNVSIGLFTKSDAFASEPFKNTIDGLYYYRVDGNNHLTQLHSGQTGFTDVKYSTNAATLIDPSIVRSANFVQNANNAAVWGVASGDGSATEPFLNWTNGKDAAYETMITEFISRQGLEGTADDYRLVPYVIKFQANGGGGDEGANGRAPTSGNWYVDCFIVKNDKYTISYDANIEYGYTASGKLPNGANVNAGTDYTVLKHSLTVTKEGELEDYTATFLYWEDQYGNHWNPNDVITNVQQNYTLKAIWSYPDQKYGSLRITKQVKVAEGSLAPDANQSFTINVGFGGQSVSAKYTIYDSAMLPISGGTGSFNAASQNFTLLAGQTVVITGIDKDVTYTVTETPVPENYTPSYEFSNSAKKITAGITDSVNVINTYENLVYTIVHVRNGVEVNRESNLKVNGSIDITSKTSPGYLYGGTFTGVDMETIAINGNPKSFVPEAGATYYIKEVLPYYLQPQYFCVYDNYRGGKIVNVYLITALDDNNYKEVGFNNLSRTIAESASSNTAYNFFTVKNFEYVVNNPETDVKNQDNHITGNFTGTGSKDFAFSDIFGISGKDGVLYAAKSTTSDYNFTSISYTAYYVTKDNVKVTGNYKRDITVTDGNHAGMKAPLDYVGATTEYVAPTPKQAPRLTMMSSYSVNTYKSDEVALFGITKYDDGKTDSQIIPQGDNSGMIEYNGKAGFYFAGWFTDETYTEACDFSNVSSEMTAYAKYIPQSAISVSASKSGLSLKNFSIKSAVDVKGNEFKEVGVVYNVNGNETTVAAQQTENKLNAFLNVFGANKSTVEYTASLDVKGMASNTQFTVTPYWVTMDGTTVYGNPVNYTYRLGIVVKG